MTEYDARLVQGHVSRSPTSTRPSLAFAALTSASAAGLPGIQPGREDVILAGALIAREACQRSASTLCASARRTSSRVLPGACRRLAHRALSGPLWACDPAAGRAPHQPLPARPATEFPRVDLPRPAR